MQEVQGGRQPSLVRQYDLHQSQHASHVEAGLLAGLLRPGSVGVMQHSRHAGQVGEVPRVQVLRPNLNDRGPWVHEHDIGEGRAVRGDEQSAAGEQLGGLLQRLVQIIALQHAAQLELHYLETLSVQLHQLCMQRVELTSIIDHDRAPPL